MEAGGVDSWDGCEDGGESTLERSLGTLADLLRPEGVAVRLTAVGLVSSRGRFWDPNFDGGETADDAFAALLRSTGSGWLTAW